MRKKLSFLMLFAALMVPWSMKAQVTCDGGAPLVVSNADTSTTTTSYIPGYSLYNYSFSEVLILADDLIGIGDIKALQFKPASTSAGSYFTNCEIYLANTDLEDLSAGFLNDASAFELVWSGNMSYTVADWQTIEFDDPFAYDGSSNLIVAVRRNHGSWTSGSSFAAFAADAQLARYVYQDSGPYTIGSLPSGTATSTVPWYKLIGCDATPVSCNRVRAFHADSIATYEVYLTWIDTLNSGASYTIYNMADSSVIATGITDDNYIVSGLSANTVYRFGITADCGGGDESDFAKTTVRTGCAVITGLTENFESGEDPCWTLYTTSSSNYPRIDDGSLLFYGYQSSGTTSYYSYAVTPEFADSLNLYELEFDMTKYYNYTNYFAHLYVCAVVDPNDVSTFDTLADFSANVSGQWESFHLSLENYHGEGHYIAFLADVVTPIESYSYNYPLIDNVYVGRISSCPKPSRLHARDITSTGAQIAWDANDDYSIVTLKWSTVDNIDLAIDSTEVGSDNTFDLTDLSAATTYYVWAYAQCSEEDSRVVSTSFTTLTSCEPVTNFTVDNVGYNAASFSWTPNDVTTATLYNFMWRPDSSSTWISDTTSNTYYLLNGLSEGVSYTAMVTAECGETATSSEETVGFTTMLHGTLGADEGNYYLPSYPLYEYSISEQMWTADELANYGTTVNGIRFHTNSSIAGRVMDIYVGNTTLSDITTDSFVGSDAMTLVYSDTADIVPGWNTFTFSTPFTRDATSNLVVLFYDHTGSWQSFSGWTACNSDIHSLYAYRDDTPYSTTDLSGLNNPAARAIMQLDATLTPRTCGAPVAVVAETEENSITVAWLPGLTETAWSVDYRQVGDTTWSNATASTTETSFVIGGLDASTHYEFRVGALCTGETRYGTVDGYTACATFSAPYTETFDAMSSGDYVMNPCWVKGSSTGDNPYTVNIVGAGMMMVMPVGSYVIFPQFSDAVNEMQLRAQFVVANTDIYTLVGVCDHPNDILSMTVIDTVRNTTAGVPEWHTITFDTYDGAEGYIVIYSNYSQSYFDNINLELMPMCKPADSLQASNITTTSADISWAIPENATGYLVEYGVAGSGVTTAVSASSNSITLNGLHHSTTYEVTVRTACAVLADSSLSGAVLTFTTECDVVDTLPYVMDFEHCNAPALTYTGMLPNCWNYEMTGSSYNSGNYVPMLYLGSSYASSGNYSLRMAGVSVVTLPEMPAGIDSLMISFHDYCSYQYYGLILGVCDSNWGRFADSFEPVDTIFFEQNGSYHYDIVSYALGGYTGTGRYIAFKNFYNSSYTYDYSYHYIDDIVVDYLPSCLPVQNLHASATTLTDVTIDWTDLRPSTDWEVAYSTSALTDPSTGIVVTANAHPYTITGLADSNYYIYVRNVCSTTDQSIWSRAIMVHPGYFNMRANAIDTLQLCGGHLFDDGGPNGTYSASQNSTVVLTADSGYVVVLNGTSYTEGNFDYLRIYDGIGTDGTELWSDYGVSATTPITDIASSDGPLTLVFLSDGSIQYAGFDIEVSCEPNACPISDIRINPAAPLMTTSIPLIWNGSSSSYEIEYGEHGFVRGTGTTATTTTNSLTLTGVTGSTTYDVYVRGFCDPDTSRWFRTSVSTPICDAAHVATTGDNATGTSYYAAPVNNYYNYSLVSTIIDSAELAGVGDISTISYNYAYTDSSTVKDSVVIWIQPTNLVEFTSEEDYEPVDTTIAVKVYEGPLNCGQGWNHFTLSTPYTWNGHSNLMIIVDDNSGDYDGYNYTFNTVACSEYKTLAFYADGTNPDAFDSVPDAYSTVLQSRVQMQLTSCGNPCFAPVNLTADTSSYNSLTFNWADADSAEVVLMEGLWNEDNYDPATSQISTTGTVTFTGLNYNTQYTVAVRQVCGEETTSEWVMMTVYTADLPCFAPGQPTVTETGYYSASFNWTAGGIEQAWLVRVYNSTFEFTDTALTTTYTVEGLTPKVTYNVTVSSLCGAGYILTSEPSPAASFTTDSCAVPTGLAASQVTANSAVISWNGTGAVKYELEYGDRNFNQGFGTLVTVEGGATTYTLTGLEQQNPYDVYVRAYCDETLYSGWSAVAHFTTTEGEGINDVSGADINLYPNPASASVTLTGIEGEATVTIVDLNGRTVYTATASSSLTIDLTGYAKGAYFVRVTGEQTTAIRKLIVK